ncbi:MAG: enolase C-terminal domain-like protein, partial [Elusimicrobia bacterium]|nr:enolase C-terminal domain-like protein [Elusimicrobiota bacterium]
MIRTAVASARVALVESPLKRPFITAQGRRDRTVNAAITVRLGGGAAGYGEASTSIAQKHLTPLALRGALEKMALRARGRDVRDWRALVDEAWARHGTLSPAVAAFEAALLSALAEESGTGLAGWLGGAQRRLETDLTISASNDPDETRAAAAEAAAAGFRLLKIKVGGRKADDLARVRAVREAAPKARLLLDGNQGFAPAAALRFIETVMKTGATVELFEQPTPKADLEALAFVARRCPVPVAADESVATPADAVRAVSAGVTAINIKLAKSGISRGLEIAAVANAAGLPLMIGCMAETARGLAARVHPALGT